MLGIVDVLVALKDAGYNTNRLRKEKLLAEGVIQSLRENKPISWANLAKICTLLNIQPGDLLESVDDEQEKQEKQEKQESPDTQTEIIDSEPDASADSEG